MTYFSAEYHDYEGTRSAQFGRFISNLGNYNIGGTLEWMNEMITAEMLHGSPTAKDSGTKVD